MGWWQVDLAVRRAKEGAVRYSVVGALIALGSVACGGAPSEPPTATPPPATPTAAATTAPTAPVPTASPAPPAAPTAAAPARLVVGNTDGEGVNLRRQPDGEEVIRAWPDGTELEPTGQRTTAGGRDWIEVRDPDGNVGWVVAEFVAPQS